MSIFVNKAKGKNQVNFFGLTEKNSALRNYHRRSGANHHHHTVSGTQGFVIYFDADYSVCAQLTGPFFHFPE